MVVPYATDPMPRRLATLTQRFDPKGANEGRYLSVYWGDKPIIDSLLLPDWSVGAVTWAFRCFGAAQMLRYRLAHWAELRASLYSDTRQSDPPVATVYTRWPDGTGRLVLPRRGVDITLPSWAVPLVIEAVSAWAILRGYRGWTGEP